MLEVNIEKKMIVKCDEIIAITRVVRVLIKNKIARLIITKIKIVKNFQTTLIAQEFINRSFGAGFLVNFLTITAQ